MSSTGASKTINGQTYHKNAVPAEFRTAVANTMDERPGDYITSTYVQNEEQQESNVWSRIATKTLTEDQYLNAVKENQQKKDA